MTIMYIIPQNMAKLHGTSGHNCTLDILIMINVLMKFININKNYNIL